jgi:hypothetical protein
MRDFWGRPITRPIAPHLIRNALIDHLHRPDNLLLRSLRAALGHAVAPGDLKQVKVRLFQEGEFQYIFRVDAGLTAAPAVTLAMPVAKGGGKISRTAAVELQHLHELYARDARYVVRPFEGGSVAVTAPGDTGKNGTVFVYLTTWLAALHELGVDEHHNYFINELPFHTFDRKASDRIRGTILTILLSLYDPQRQRAMEPPQIASGDFVISRPKPNAPHTLKLIACRRMLSGVTLDKCLRLYLGYHGIWADKTFHLLPRDPRLLANALRQGLVDRNPGIFTWEQVLDAVRRYAAGLRSSALDQTGMDWTPLPHLRQVLRSP